MRISDWSSDVCSSDLAVLSGEKRNATVKAAVGSEVIKLTGAGLKAMLAARPQVREATAAAVAERAAMNGFIESPKARYTLAVDLYSDTASFLMQAGHCEATHELLIDEKMHLGCAYCDK